MFEKVMSPKGFDRLQRHRALGVEKEQLVSEGVSQINGALRQMMRGEKIEVSLHYRFTPVADELTTLFVEEGWKKLKTTKNPTEVLFVFYK